MTIHEYGADREKVIVLIHPSVVMWDYFENVIPLLKDKYHLIIPALPGYDEENPNEDFTSVEEIADNLAKWLIEHKIRRLSFRISLMLLVQNISQFILSQTVSEHFLQ